MARPRTNADRLEEHVGRTSSRHLESGLDGLLNRSMPASLMDSLMDSTGRFEALLTAEVREDTVSKAFVMAG